MKKIILIIIDGLGDKPIKALGNKTPLEAAKTPNLDWLARNGRTGLVLAFCQKGKLITSEDTHLALFGYNPQIYNPGRGVLEVLGIGLKILPGDVCLRGNFATVDKNLKIIDRRAGRIEKTEPLIQSLKGIEIEGIKFLIKKSYGHRAVLVLRCSTCHVEHLSEKISDGDPKRVGLRVKKILPLDRLGEAKFTAKILNAFLEKAYLILKNHPLNQKRKLPANYILVRGAGKFKKVKSFKEKYGLKACFIAGGALYKGIGKFFGMDEMKVKRANALPTTNLRGKFFAVKKALKKYDFVFLHIKAADNLAEDGNFQGKKKFIEKIDKNLKILIGRRVAPHQKLRFGAGLVPHRASLWCGSCSLKNSLIVVTADHSTCSLLKRHCSEPIPILIFGNGRDSVRKFSERACRKGKIGKIKQINLMKKVLALAPTPNLVWGLVKK